MAINRAAAEAAIRAQFNALERQNPDQFCAHIHPAVTATFGAVTWQGIDEVCAAMQEQMFNYTALQLRIVRLLVDVEQQAAGVYWIQRSVTVAHGDCVETQGGTIIEFDNQLRMRHFHFYLDTIRRRIITGINEPWPEVGWSPARDSGQPPSRAAARQIIHAHARAWSSHELAQLRAVFHDEICVCPPWDFQQGWPDVARAAEIYFANYTDTHVTPRRVLFDSAQPNFGFCEQTFACTNPDTGRRGADEDLAFFEIAQGKLRYWRTWFDTSSSVQSRQKTAGHILKGLNE
ncbi:MAG: nuclear transport factor 2 family protein [Chloroflexi bacterium]|nr:MAG: nuclear transport factor 2 family protein [Chloroflexota bacterium]